MENIIKLSAPVFRRRVEENPELKKDPRIQVQYERLWECNICLTDYHGSEVGAKLERTLFVWDERFMSACVTCKQSIEMVSRRSRLSRLQSSPPPPPPPQRLAGRNYPQILFGPGERINETNIFF